MMLASLKSEFSVIWKFFYNNALAYLMLYLQNFLINRYMPTEAIGQFSYCQSILTLLVSVYSMEIYSSYLRFMGYTNNQSLIDLIKKVMIVASALFSISVLWFFREPGYILFFGFMWMQERLYFFRSKLQINLYGQVKIIQYLLSLLSIGALIYYNSLNERTLLICIGLSYVLVAIFYNYYGSKDTCDNTTSLDNVNAKEVFQYAVPLSFNAIVVWILGAADQMLIDCYLDNTTLAYYSVAFRIIGIIRIGSGVILEYWPRFYFERMETKDFHSVKQMQFLFLCFVTLLSLGSMYFADYLYIILGASAYTNNSWMFFLLALAEMFRQWGSIGITFQSFKKNTVINISCLSILGISKLVFNCMYIDEYGVIILFYSTIACYFLYLLCGLYFGILRERHYMQSN